MRRTLVSGHTAVFSRQVGIDPDTDRTPVEALAVERLRKGAPLRPRGRCVTIAIAEPGVPVFALDADKLDGQLGSESGARGGVLFERRPVAAGQLVVPPRGSVALSWAGVGPRGVNADTRDGRGEPAGEGSAPIVRTRQGDRRETLGDSA